MFERSQSFEFLRAFGCILVIIEHIFLPGWIIEYLHFQWCFSLGGLGIGIFTFVSGYLIARSLETKSLREYAASRFWRVYPAYLCVLFIALGIFLVFGYSRLQPTEEASLRGVLAQALFVRDIYNMYNPLISADWTLLYEVQFYVVAGIAWVAFRPSRKTLILIGVYMAITALIYVYLWSLSLQYLHGQAAMQRTGGSLFCFMGMLYYLHRRRELPYGWVVIAAVWTLGTVAFSQFAGEFHYEYLQVSVTQLYGMVLAAAFIRWDYTGKFARVFGFIASISFPLYLLHQTFGTVGFSQITGTDIAFGWFWDRMLTFVLIVVPLSVAIHKLVEKPAMGWGRRSTPSMVPQSA